MPPIQLIWEGVATPHEKWSESVKWPDPQVSIDGTVSGENLFYIYISLAGNT